MEYSQFVRVTKVCPSAALTAYGNIATFIWNLNWPLSQVTVVTKKQQPKFDHLEIQTTFTALDSKDISAF